MKTKPKSVSSLKGLIVKPASPVSIEEMNKVVKLNACSSYQLSKLNEVIKKSQS